MKSDPCDAQTLSYVSRWFWRLDRLATAAGVSPADANRMIDAGCAPGPIYARTAEGGWWSALGAAMGRMPSQPVPEATRWYSRSAAWDLRRASLLTRRGESLAAAAASNRESFVQQFISALQSTEGARDAFGRCWEGEALDFAQAREAAASEWAAWLRGGYGVCLRVFTAETCVRKEALRAGLIRDVAEGEAFDLLDRARALALLVLPFAPWERPTGSPGLTIDALLRRLNLGDEFPYS